MVVTVVEAVKIQSYVFGSNRLRENIGASYLVWAATELWPFQTLVDLGLKCNVQITGNLPTIDDTRQIDADGLDAEVVYAGGGNAMIVFRERQKAQEFTRELSRRALEEAPGLRLLVATESFQWSTGKCNLAPAVQRAFDRLERMKRAPKPSAPLLGLGVTVPCASTGMPAVAYADVPDGTREPVSAEVAAKLEAADQANQRLSEAAGSVLVGSKYAFPQELDRLGRGPGEFSYIAVGHADGDSMGEKIRNVSEAAKNDRDYIRRMRAFSRAVEAAGRSAFEDVLNDLLAKIGWNDGQPVIREDGGNGELIAELRLSEKTNRRGKSLGWYLPFRPLIFGGDDFTFVSDGRLGLALLQKFMRAFREAAARRKDDLGGEAVTASGGVAIVKAHYPFARAYALAEELCHSAKHYRREAHVDQPFLDWHFAQAGLLGCLGEIRDRLYKTAHGSLLLRPVRLEEDPDDPRSWPVVARGIDAFRGDDWFGRRNKMKALMTALREGPEAVKRFRTLYNDDRRLPHLHQQRLGWPNAGWERDACGYFDSLELVDWYISL